MNQMKAILTIEDVVLRCEQPRCRVRVEASEARFARARQTLPLETLTNGHNGFLNIYLLCEMML